MRSGLRTARRDSIPPPPPPPPPEPVVVAAAAMPAAAAAPAAAARRVASPPPPTRAAPAVPRAVQPAAQSNPQTASAPSTTRGRDRQGSDAPPPPPPVPVNGFPALNPTPAASSGRAFMTASSAATRSAKSPPPPSRAAPPPPVTSPRIASSSVAVASRFTPAPAPVAAAVSPRAQVQPQAQSPAPPRLPPSLVAASLPVKPSVALAASAPGPVPLQSLMRLDDDSDDDSVAPKMRLVGGGGASKVAVDSDDDDDDDSEAPPPPPPDTSGIVSSASLPALSPLSTTLSPGSMSPPIPLPSFMDSSGEDDSDVEVEPVSRERSNSTSRSAFGTTSNVSSISSDVVSPLQLASAASPPSGGRQAPKLAHTAPTASTHLGSKSPPMEPMISSALSHRAAMFQEIAAPKPAPTLASALRPHSPLAFEKEAVPSPPPSPPPPPPPPPAAVVADTGVSLAALSHQLSLHMELQTFAHHRAESIAASGGQGSSLIPQIIPPAIPTGAEARPLSPAKSATSNSPSSAAAATASSVAGDDLPVLRRTTSNIRSMSMSLQHAPGASLASDSAGAIRPSFSRVESANSAVAAAAKKRRQRAKVRAERRSDAEVLDLFGDGSGTASAANQPVPPVDLRSPSISSHNRSARKAPFGSLASITEASSEGQPRLDGKRSPQTGARSGTNSGMQSIRTTVSSTLSSARNSALAAGNLSDPPSSEDDDGDIPPPPPPLESTPPPLTPDDAVLTTTDEEQTMSAEDLILAAEQAFQESIGETDDITATFKPPPHTNLARWPVRKVIKAPLRTTACLEPPSPNATEAALDTQLRMLTLLSDTLRASREEFQTLCIDNVREENAALRKRVEELRAAAEGGPSSGTLRASYVPGRSMGPGKGGLNIEQIQLDTLRRSLRALAPHSRWNHAVHAAHGSLTLNMEEMRRRCQLSLPVSFSSALLAREGVDESSELSQTSPSHSYKNLGSGQHAAVSSVSALAGRPVVSQLEVSTKARALAPAHACSPSPTTPFGDSLPSGVPQLTATTSGNGGGGASSQIHRFAITKINLIRKNTPRVLELDLTTRTLTICKHHKAGPASSSSGAAATMDAEFINRDIVITRQELVAAELHARDVQMDLSFHVAPVQTSAQALMAGTSSANNAGGSPGSSQRSVQADKDADKRSASSVKHWKILFASRDERERFYSMLQSSLLQNGSGAGGAPSANTSPAAVARARLGVGGPSDSLSTSYPTPNAPPGSTSMQTYHPRPGQLTPAVLQQVRVLPLLPLASALHTIYCLTKKQAGWKYGVKLEDTTIPGAPPPPAGPPARKTHPMLVPFNALPPARRDYNIQVVTQTLSTVLSMGFTVTRPGGGSGGGSTNDGGSGDSSRVQHLLAATQKAQHAALGSSGSGLGSGGVGSAFASPQSGSLAPALLGMLDLLAAGAHDLWATDKLARGFRWGAVADLSRRTHPSLVPYGVLAPAQQEKVRKQALKILGTLVEWGYSIEPDAHTPASPSSTNATKRTPLGTAAATAGASPLQSGSFRPRPA